MKIYKKILLKQLLSLKTCIFLQKHDGEISDNYYYSFYKTTNKIITIFTIFFKYCDDILSLHH